MGSLRNRGEHLKIVGATYAFVRFFIKNSKVKQFNEGLESDDRTER